MYAGVSRKPDGGAPRGGYVDQVDIPAPRVARFTARLRAIDPRVIDALLGTAFTALGLVGLYLEKDPKHLYRSVDALGVVLYLCCSVPYFVRRRAPLSVLMINTIALVLLLTMKYPADVQSQMLLVGAFTVGSHSEGYKRSVAVFSVGIGLAIVAVVGIPDTNGVNLALTSAIYVAAYLFGSTVRNRRLYTEQLEQRAASMVRDRDEEAKRAVADERLRIAQELHDVVAHSMGVIVVQAGVGEHVIDQDPAEAKRALAAIATTSRSTLTEIRRLLGVLREHDGAEHGPAPGLADLGKLVANLADAGLKVDVCRSGQPLDLPAGVDLTAYRIVQEGLTNALKHAGPATARVIVTYEPGALRLEVTDDGRGVNARATAGGHGLIGMRERVAVYGGTLETGPRHGGGYQVVAYLPYGAQL
jgi:signal transduction histidine kinase